MSKLELTYEEARALLERAIAEKGADYVYERHPHPEYEDGQCLYRHNGAPSCIVGHVLYHKGIEVEPIFEGEIAPTVLSHYLPDTPKPVVEALSAAQADQDSGLSWGTALEAFDDVYAAEIDA